MGVTNVLELASEYDLAAADGSRDSVTEFYSYRPRTVTLGGTAYRTSQDVLDRVAAGEARFAEYGGRWHLVEYEGATLGPASIQVMSDVWEAGARVWDGKRVREVLGGCAEDATPEVLAAVRAVSAEAEYRAARAAEERAWLADAQEASSRTRPGARVRVARGRKVPIGTEGEVFWTGEGYLGRGTRVGLRDAGGGVHWTDAGNLDPIVDPDDIPALSEYRAPEADLRAAAAERAARSWPAPRAAAAA